MIVELTKGYSAIVDDGLSLISDYTYYASVSEYGVYAGRNENGRRIYLHREIMELHLGRKLKEKEEVDHKNRNTLDNRIENLRLATSSQNQSNKGMRSDNTTGVRGVTWHKASKKWRACISINGEHKHLGTFVNQDDAICAYNKAALLYHEEFATLNN